MKILLTGCAGFIGSHILARLLADGHDVAGLDDLSTGSRENIAPHRTGGRFRFLEGSVCDAAAVEKAVAGAEAVIHLAAVPSVPRSVDFPLESAAASVIGTVTLLDAARKAGVKRVVQAASSSAYGDGPGMPRVETMLPEPMSPYAAAKLAQEYYAAVFYKSYGLDTVSLRYFNVFGPRQRPDSLYAAVIPKFIARMQAGQRPEIYGDGRQSRDFTYVDNVVDANIAALAAPGPLGGAVMNVATGGSASLLDLVERLNALLGTNLAPVFLPARAGDVRDSQADITLAGKVLGFRPRVDFAEGLRRTVEAMTAAK